MKNFKLCVLILSFILITGCSQQAETPPIDDTKSTETTSTNGNLNADVVIANLESFTVNELIEFFPKSDGAATDGITDELSKRLQNDFNGVVSSMANADLSNDMRNTLAWYIGADLRNREITDEESEILYSASDLTEQEQKVLNKIIEGFEVDNELPYSKYPK